MVLEQGLKIDPAEMFLKEEGQLAGKNLPSNA